MVFIITKMEFLLTIQSFKEQCMNEGKKKKNVHKLKHIAENYRYIQYRRSSLPGDTHISSLLIQYNNYDNELIHKQFARGGNNNKYETKRIQHIVNGLCDTTNINILNWVTLYKTSIKATAIINLIMQNHTDSIRILLNHTLLPPDIIRIIISYGYYPTLLDCLIDLGDVLPIIKT